MRSGPTAQASPQLDPRQQLDSEYDDREFNDTVDALEDALEVVASAIRRYQRAILAQLREETETRQAADRGEVQG